jgi:pimeloyl-ACP methyl ester carboxylesterase
MKRLILLLLLVLTTCVFGQKKPSQVYVFVPGAWDGGWDYQKVDSILTSQGNHVYRATLTGLGDRVHLADTAINLTTHINDIINLIKYEKLRNVILVGHSYGGMVISGVAEQVPDRIQKLIYLDALVPENGESLQTIIPPALWDQMFVPKIKDGFVYYVLGATSPNPPNDVPQSLKTFTEKIKISNPKVLEIPTCYILMTKDGKAGFFQSQADRAKQRKWKVLTLEGGHYAMRDQPEKLVKKLEEALK